MWLLLTSGILIGSSTGVGRVVHYLFDIPVSYTVFAFNGILFLTGQMKAE
ncbi:YitT family protein [Emergencia timonensis]|nr:YitT family protein [Emergencia timonensis]